MNLFLSSEQNTCRIKNYLYFLFVLVFFAGKIIGQEMPVPIAMQGELIPKILLLNKGISKKETINFGIIYSNYSRNSFETKNIILERIKSAKVGININVIPIELTEQDNLRQTLNPYSLDAVYIAPLRGINLLTIKTYCKENKIITFCGTPELITHYFSVGFDLINNKIKIKVNLKSVAEEGGDFSSSFLKIAQVIN